MKYISKNDYLKLGDRIDVHLTIREDLYEQVQIMSIKLKEPCTKIFDVMIQELLNDKEKLSDFKNKVKLYR